MMKDDTDYKRIMVALFLAAVVLTGWQVLVEWPRRQQLAQLHTENTVKREKAQAEAARSGPLKDESEAADNLTREQRLAGSARIAIRSDKLHGSIALKGARFDDLMLAKYRVTMEKDSPEVTLFSPQGDKVAYFAQAGWVSPDHAVKVPDQASRWQADKTQLTPQSPVELRWDNGEGQTFILKIALDADYMFTIEQRVENRAARAVTVMPYAYLNRTHDDTAQPYAISHEGPLGVMDGTLKEIPYKDLREKGNQSFERSTGWLGVTDKYWLGALAPQGEYTAGFSHYMKGSASRYQVDALGAAVSAPASGSAESRLQLFAGAKEIHVLDRYAEGGGSQPPIPLFDRAVDFGVLYFLTKPLFLLLTFFYAHIGNFGIAIMLLTIVVKLAMYPLANKSFHSMAQMRELQPEMMKIRERYADDSIAMNKEMMALYKREKVNPAAGCLPILLQMPVFFALYKVLFVTIEMRHAPFFWWIRDLSAPDMSNLFTAFGLLPWDAPHWLHLGVLPMLFGVTMIIQMKQQPKPADPVQAKMMTFMPYFFVVLFAGFPAGLVVYWVWSNVLSIIQQQIITRRHHAAVLRKKARAAA